MPKPAGRGVAPVGNTPEAFVAYIKTEAAKYAEAIKKSAARVDQASAGQESHRTV